MLFSDAAHTRLSAAMIALVSVLSGSAFSADLAAQRANPSTTHVLYETRTFDDWSISSTTPDWARLRNMLLNRGTAKGAGFVPIFAPYRPTSADYAVEAEIRVIRDENSFGLVARGDVRTDGRNEGYAAGIGANLARPVQRTTSLCYLNGVMTPFVRNHCIGESGVFNPSTEWHTYRLEANENKLILRLDDHVMINMADNRFLADGRVGL